MREPTTPGGKGGGYVARKAAVSKQLDAAIQGVDDAMEKVKTAAQEFGLLADVEPDHSHRSLLSPCCGAPVRFMLEDGDEQPFAKCQCGQSWSILVEDLRTVKPHVPGRCDDCGQSTILLAKPLCSTCYVKRKQQGVKPLV